MMICGCIPLSGVLSDRASASAALPDPTPGVLSALPENPLDYWRSLRIRLAYGGSLHKESLPMPEPKSSVGSMEIEVLRYIGDHYPIGVAEVAEHFAQTTGHARTTILTMMERLRRKGHLTRRRASGVYRYSPKVAKHELLQGLVKDFVARTLGGSVSPFVAYLSESGPISEEDLDTLKRLVRDLDQHRKEDQP
jgi:predicted transcriptional regulator